MSDMLDVFSIFYDLLSCRKLYDWVEALNSCVRLYKTVDKLHTSYSQLIRPHRFFYGRILVRSTICKLHWKEYSQLVAYMPPTWVILPDYTVFQTGIVKFIKMLWTCLYGLCWVPWKYRPDGEVKWSGSNNVQKVYLVLAAATMVEWCIEDKDQTVLWKQSYCD